MTKLRLSLRPGSDRMETSIPLGTDHIKESRHMPHQGSKFARETKRKIAVDKESMGQMGEVGGKRKKDTIKTR